MSIFEDMIDDISKLDNEKLLEILSIVPVSDEEINYRAIAAREYSERHNLEQEPDYDLMAKEWEDDRYYSDSRIGGEHYYIPSI